jgi:hypothetical protein
MPELLVQIDRFMDEHPPGFVACSVVDAMGTRHEFVEKVPIVTTENVSKDSSYPAPGTVACRVEREWQAPNGRRLIQVNTEQPWHVESVTGESVFVVLPSQVRERDPGFTHVRTP